VNGQLSPAEALVLLKPNRPADLESVKVTLLWLSAQGLLRIEEETKRTFLGSKRIVWVQPTGRECAALWPEAASVMAVVSEAHACGGMLEYLAKRARPTYGNEFTGFLSQFIMPSLARRELLEERLVLRLFPKTYLTHAGTAEKTRIAADIAQALTVPALQSGDPAEAAAVALTVGGSVLPVEELQHHYRQFSQVIRKMSSSHRGTEVTWGGGT
jgi:hypothetical protein